LGGHILLILFGIFEQFQESKEIDFDTFVKSILSKMDWGEQKYLERYDAISIPLPETLDILKTLSEMCADL
jgi:hypothetical protein